mgnify:FL=1
MRWWTNLILTAILIALGCWYYFFDVRGEAVRIEKKSEESRLLPGIVPETVYRLTIARSAATDRTVPVNDAAASIVLSKSGDQWRLEAPLAVPASKTVVESLVREIVELPSTKTLEGGTPDTFGLDHPALTILVASMNAEGVSTDHRIEIGNENPSGQYVYARSSRDDRTRLVSNEIRNRLTRGGDFYRDRRILISRFDSIRELEVHLAGQAPILLSDGPDQWRVAQPVEAPGDVSRISELTGSIQNQEAQAFIDENPSDLARFGLDAPYLTLRVSGSNADDDPESILVGAVSDSGGKFRFAKQASRSVVFTVGNDFVDRFSHDPFTYRNKDVCSFERSEIERIAIEHDGARLTLERQAVDTDTDETWTCVEPRVIPTDSVAVGAYLSDLVYLRGTSTKPDSEDFGELFARITLTPKGTESRAYEIVIGGRPLSGSGRWIRSTGSDVVFGISESDVARLIKSEFDFRDKRIVKLTRDELSDITIENSRGKLRIEAARSRYSIVEPKGYALEQSALDDIAWNLLNLTMVRIASESVENQAEYGLVPAGLTIGIGQKNGTRMHILLGRTTDDGKSVFGMVKDIPVVFEISRESVAELIKLQDSDLSAATPS